MWEHNDSHEDPGEANYAETGCCRGSQVFIFMNLDLQSQFNLSASTFCITAKMSTERKTLQQT